MRITVDSKEFAEKLRGAARYSGSSASVLSQCTRLEAREDGLVIYTTNFVENCQVFVHKIGEGEVEPGAVLMTTEKLLHIAEDSGGPVTVRETEKQVVLEYGNGFKPHLLKRSESPDEFPAWINAQPVISIPPDVLRTVLAAADKKLSGRPVTMAAHLFEMDGKVCAMSTNAIVGSRILLDGVIDRHLALDSKMLTSALPLFGSMVSIGLDREIVELSAGAARVSFPSLNIWPHGVDGASAIRDIARTVFCMEPICTLTVPRETIIRLIHRSRQARNIDDAAEVWLSAGLEAEFRGEGYEAPAIQLAAEGEIGTGLSLYCKNLSDYLSDMRETDTYTIHVVRAHNNSMYVYIDGLDGERFEIPCITPGLGRFANKILSPETGGE